MSDKTIGSLSKSDVFAILDYHPDLLREYLQSNLVDKIDAKDITNQAQASFNQSVRLGYVTPIFQINRDNRIYHRLYLKQDLKDYYDQKRNVKVMK